MNIVFTMTLSGSMMTMIYLLVRYGPGRKAADRWQYLLWRAAVLYYLIPLPFLKTCYQRIAGNMLDLWKQRSEAGRIVYTYTGESLVIDNGTRLLTNEVLKLRLGIFILWICIALLIMAVQIMRYRVAAREIRKLNWMTPDEPDRILVEMWLSRYGIRRNVVLHAGNCEDFAFSMGVFKPEVFYSVRETPEDRAMVLHHELVHIKRWDALWKMLSVLVICVHWYNPLAWLLQREWREICEQSCDSEVLRGKNLEERYRYSIMVVRGAAVRETATKCSVAFRQKNEKINRRLDNIVNGQEKETKRWQRWLSTCMVGLAVLLNSLTVYAYEDVQYRVLDPESENYEQDLDSMMHHDMAFIPVGYTGELEAPFQDAYEMWRQEIRYDVQFVDGDGNIFPVENQAQTYVLCKFHEYVMGQLTEHVKNADGSCTITFYEARRCTTCGYVERGEKISETIFYSCNH